MDFFQWILILCLIVGAIFVLYSIVNFHGKAQKEDEQEGGLASAEALLAEKLSAYQSSVVEADEAISELNDVSRSVFKEFDSKYQELLFLYNLIEEKKQELNQPIAAPIRAVPPSKVSYIVDDSTKKSAINPKFAHVLELSRKGMNVDEIARQLDMGKGEIALILNLGGGGDA